MKENNLPPVDTLRNDCISTESVDYDFGQGYSEEWEYCEAVKCEACGKAYLTNFHEDECECGEGSGYAEGPMMNYYYPLPEERTEPKDAKEIIDLPLCLIYFYHNRNCEWALALTGGGMDLSWEICEAYMKLGYLPPLHFCDLPEMAGKQLNERNKWILEGCRRSIEIAGSWTQYKMNRLNRLEENMKGEKGR